MIFTLTPVVFPLKPVISHLNQWFSHLNLWLSLLHLWLFLLNQLFVPLKPLIFPLKPVIFPLKPAIFSFEPMIFPPEMSLRVSARGWAGSAQQRTGAEISSSCNPLWKITIIGLVHRKIYRKTPMISMVKTMVKTTCRLNQSNDICLAQFSYIIQLTLAKRLHHLFHSWDVP